ncbi:MAG TPA: alpha/beta fold hydrolase, partial [Pyrinomonadaceae bacterium]|nr:alpha/beta fold hydrolase [Pyrinomonadaceae bacterium]
MKYLLLASLLAVSVVSVYGTTPEPRHAEVRLGTGVRMHYVEQGDPKGPTIILLHGYSDSWVSYTRVLPLLDKKYHVYAPDLRGHGASDRPASGYTFPDFAGDIIAFMDAKGIKKASIV